MRLNTSSELEAIGLRHSDVGQHHVRGLIKALHSLRHAGSSQHFGAHHLEQLVEQFARILVVIDDEDAKGHSRYVALRASS